MWIFRILLLAMAVMPSFIFANVSVPIYKMGHNYAINFTINGEIYYNVVCFVLELYIFILHFVRILSSTD